MTDAAPEIPEELAAQGFSSSPTTSQVLLVRSGSLGRIMLNRPRAINALTTEMVDAVTGALEEWRDDAEVTAITIEGAGERGLCAGGDVKGVREAFVNGKPDAAFDFFEREYRMNALITDYPKLIVSYQDGIVMGGGVGISAYAGLRIATERTKVAMPETIIGFFPDVGALYLLSRAPGGTGAYLALTGETVTGSDAITLGLSDAVVDATAWQTIVEKLSGGATRDDVVNLVRTMSASTERELPSDEPWLDEAFGVAPQYRRAEDILTALEESDAPKARSAAEALRARSPLSVCATLEALSRAATMPSIHEVLAQDARLARGLVEHGDFVEGVRAQLVDKDRNPKWSQPSLADVSDADVEHLFT